MALLAHSCQPHDCRISKVPLLILVSGRSQTRLAGASSLSSPAHTPLEGSVSLLQLLLGQLGLRATPPLCLRLFASWAKGRKVLQMPTLLSVFSSLSVHAWQEAHCIPAGNPNPDLPWLWLLALQQQCLWSKLHAVPHENSFKVFPSLIIPPLRLILPASSPQTNHHPNVSTGAIGCWGHHCPTSLIATTRF